MTAASGFCFIMAGLCALMLCGIIAAFIFPPSPLGSQADDLRNGGVGHFNHFNHFEHGSHVGHE